MLAQWWLELCPRFGPSIYSNWTRTMVPPQAIPILGKMEDTPVQVSYLWIPGECQGCRPDFNNGLGDDSNSGPVLAPSVYLSSTRIMAPPQAIPILCQIKSVQSALSDLLTTSATHGTFSHPCTKRGLILIGLELNTNARESFEHCWSYSLNLSIDQHVCQFIS